MKEECHYVIEPELTYTYFADAARNNSFNREQLQKAFNNIEQSDPIFADLFADIDLYSIVWEPEIRSRVIQLQV